ncbi:type IV secretion system protein [Methylobacterium radiotolerans]|uniref:type IV secretion system protein n=1 Tax=Methylobacterium radiotolerans TaxID=31998 RepID=UPI00158DBEAF|nr:type IV secretion system protein [Methylobacterium radiotolerans]
MSAFLSYVSTPLKLALVLYVALTGIGMIRGDISEPASVFLNRFVKLALVVWVLTGSGAYQQWVYDLFFDTLPKSLANALTSSGTGGEVKADSFDHAWLTSWHAGLEVWNSLSWHDFGPEMTVILFWIASIMANVFCFAIWLISRVFLALYIAIGPLIVPLALFSPTQSIFERWIGAMISCVILQITTIVLLYITLDTEKEVVNDVANLAGVEGMQVLLCGVIFFAVAGFVAIQLPGVASSLSGGLSFHAGGVARALKDGPGSLIGSRGTTTTDASGKSTTQGRKGLLGLASGGASLARAGVSAARRLRPTGGSLSDSGA